MWRATSTLMVRRCSRRRSWPGVGGPFQMQARTSRNRPSTRTQPRIRGTMSGTPAHGHVSAPAGISIDGQTDWRATLRMAPRTESRTQPAREHELGRSSDEAAGSPRQAGGHGDAVRGSRSNGRPVGRYGGTAGAGLSGERILCARTPMPMDCAWAHPELSFARASRVSNNSAPDFQRGRLGRAPGSGGWLKLGGPDKNTRPGGGLPARCPSERG